MAVSCHVNTNFIRIHIIKCMCANFGSPIVNIFRNMPDYILKAAIFKLNIAAGYHIDSDGYPAIIYKTTSVPILVLLSQNAQSYPLAAVLLKQCLILCFTLSYCPHKS